MDGPSQVPARERRAVKIAGFFPDYFTGGSTAPFFFVEGISQNW